MKVRGFGPHWDPARRGDGLVYNEWYGGVTPKVARWIRTYNISPSDLDYAIEACGGTLHGLDARVASGLPVRTSPWRDPTPTVWPKKKKSNQPTTGDTNP